MKISPNFDARRLPVSLLVLHYTGMKTGEEALQRLCDPAAKVSAHYLVEEDGLVIPLVSEEKRAWHAGRGYWRGISDVNSASIGIEVVNPGHEFGYRPFSQPQMATVMQLCQDILSRHSIEPHNIIGHSDLAPTRKQDPGELFDWSWLAENGIGLMPEVCHQRARAEQLSEYGYDTSDLAAAITAFQRHFCPAQLGEPWNEDCAKALASLLQQIR